MGSKLITKDSLDDVEKRPTFAQILEKDKPKLIALYYSMHNCPPCREFTPMLTSLYEDLNEDTKQLEVIFFSGDKTEEEFNQYYGEMPWLALPRDRKDVMMKNAKRFKIAGVPRLIMLGHDGQVLSEQCYEQVQKQGPVVLEQFLSKV